MTLDAARCLGCLSMLMMTVDANGCVGCLSMHQDFFLDDHDDLRCSWMSWMAIDAQVVS